MDPNNDRLEMVVLIGLGLWGMLGALRHPRKTYQLLVHRVSWY